LGVNREDGKVILTWILNKERGKFYNELKRLRTARPMTASFLNCYEISDSTTACSFLAK